MVSESGAQVSRVYALMALDSLLLGVLALLASTARRRPQRVEELAVLRLLGVPERQVRRAGWRETGLLVTVAVLTSVAAGLAAARLLLPTLPLVRTGEYAVDLGAGIPVWVPVLTAALAAAVLLGAGARLAAVSPVATRPSTLREGVGGMSMLGTVLRGLRSRTLLSAGSILLIALAVGAAVLGPIFSVAVTHSYVVTRLSDAPARLTGTSWVFTPDPSDLAGRGQAVALATQAVAEAIGPGPHESQVSLESSRIPSATGDLMLLAVDDACAHLQVEGRCPARRDQALMAAQDLPVAGVELGDHVDVGGQAMVEIVGSYQIPTADDFWFEPLRLRTIPAHNDFRTGVTQRFTPAPLIVDPSTFEGLPADGWTVRVDNRLRVPPDFSPADLTTAATATDAVQDDAPQQVEGGTLRQDSFGDLAAVAAEVRSEQRAAAASIAPAVISLVLVALALLTRLLMAASELRVPELALASLRGLSVRQLWALGLAEPVMLLVLATPVGVVVGLAMAWGLARAWLVPGLPLPLPPASLQAAVLVTGAGLAVAVLAVGSVLRVSLSAQLTGVRRPGVPRRALVLSQLLLVAAAIAVVGSKLVGGEGSRPDLTDLVLPVLVAVVLGLATTRLVAGAAGAWTRRSTSGSLGGFVAARALSRRQEGTLVIIPVTVAVAIGVFSLGIYSAAATWRDSVASTRAPADAVWASPLSLRATYDLTHKLDPDGRWLMTASTMDALGGRVMVVDAPRLGRVARWPDQWTPGLDADGVSALISPSAERPLLTGTRVGLTVDRAARVEGPLWVGIRLRPVGGARVAQSAYLEGLGQGESARSVRVPACRDGCWLEGLTFAGPAGLPAVMHGTFTLSDLTVDGETVPGALGDAGWVTAPDVTGDARFGEVSVDDDRLDVAIDTFETPRPGAARHGGGPATADR